MALLGLDRLVKKDLFTAELWNNLVDILEAKFSSGISESDLAWPLLVQGDIDFQQTYGIVGLRTFWNIVNAAEYANFDAAIAAVAATGGGAIFIPPYTTISTSASTIATSNVMIFGAGPTSVLKITAAATGPLLQTSGAAITDLTLKDLLLDGTGGGAGCLGVAVKRVARFKMLNVSMLGFTDDFVVLTNGGVAGQSSTDATIDSCYFSGGTDKHIFCDDISGLTFVNNVSKSAGGDAIRMLPASSSHLIQDVLIAGNRISGGAAKGISIVGSGAAGIAAHSRIKVSNNQITSMTGLPIELGNTSALLLSVEAIGNTARASTSDGLRVAASGGEVVGNQLTTATGDGIDMQNSVDLWVKGNNCKGAGAFGINADTTTTCDIIGNNVSGAATDGISRVTSTGLRALENLGDDAPTIGNVLADFGDYIRTAGSGVGTIGAFSYTIPANSFKTGDVLRVTARITQGAGGSGDVSVRAGATSLGQVVIDATDNAVTWLVRILQSGAGTNSMITNVREGVANVLITNSSTVDWTASQAITFHAATGPLVADVHVNGIFIELLGSK